MYENTKSSIDWKGIILKTIIAFLVIAIVFTGIKTFTKSKVKKIPETTNVVESNSSTTFTANIEKLKEVGEKYFKENTDKLPKDGIASMVTLNELIKAKVITSLTDADGKACDGESSYVTAVKTGDKYAIKANLVCGESYSYVTAYLSENGAKEENETKEENKTTITTNSSTVSSSTSNKTNTTTNCGNSCTPIVSTEIKQNVTINTNKDTNTSNNNNVTVPKKQYIVSFDENGGTCNYNSYYVNEGEYASNPGNCKRSGYNFTGWTLDGKVYNFNTPVTRDIKLVAKYTKINADEDNSNHTGKDTITTLVYTMGWADENINSLTINHILDVQPAIDTILEETDLSRNDITKIRISNIRYSEAIDTLTETRKYRNYHADTFLNSASAKVNASTTNVTSSLAYVKSAEFEYDNDFVSLSSARRNGFDVTWTTNRITRTCSSPFSVTLDDGTVVNNLCNYGIIYKVTWEYKYEY